MKDNRFYLQVLGSDRPRQLGGGGGRQRRASENTESESASDTKVNII